MCAIRGTVRLDEGAEEFAFLHLRHITRSCVPFHVFDETRRKTRWRKTNLPDES